MAHRILVASNANNITTLYFDAAVGSLEVFSDVNVGHRPSWLTCHESHPAMVFTGLEQSDGKVVALRYDEYGGGEVVSEVSSAGQEPCCLLATRDEILIANVGEKNFCFIIDASYHCVISIIPELSEFFPYLRLLSSPLLRLPFI
jgi:6-phosphogluconolactonase (cycloisomerase 2 family)